MKSGIPYIEITDMKTGAEVAVFIHQIAFIKQFRRSSVLVFAMSDGSYIETDDFYDLKDVLNDINYRHQLYS